MPGSLSSYLMFDFYFPRAHTRTTISLIKKKLLKILKKSQSVSLWERHPTKTPAEAIIQIVFLGEL